MKTFASCLALCTLMLAAPALVRAEGDAKPAPAKKEAKKGNAKKPEPKKDESKKEEPKKDAAPAGGGW